MMNRVLKRPMFRMGGSSSDGIMTGVARSSYKFGNKPIDFPGTQEDYDRQMQELQDKGIFNVSGSRTGGPKRITNTENKNEFNMEDLKADDSEVTTEFERRKSLMDSLVGKSALPMSSFLTQFGLNLASASPKGNIFST